MSGCEDVRGHLGGYTLRGLPEEERRLVEDHVRACPDCARESRELAELPALLALVADAPPPPPAHLRERVVTAAARRRGRRRRLTVAAVAAALAVGVVLGGVVTAVVWPDSPEPAVVVPLTPGEGFDVEGQATFTDTSTGLRVDLDLWGLPPLPAPGVYEAWVGMPDADEPVSIGRLERDPQGRSAVTLEAGGMLEDYSGIWVTAEPDARDPAHDGPTVAAAPLPAGARASPDG